MKQLSIIALFLMISSVRNENYFKTSKAWQSICKINSCEATLTDCINHSCFGKENCRSCVEDYLPSCTRCVDDIYDATALITLPDNRKTIICDMMNQLHLTVCNFFCRSSYKPNFKCEIINDFPVCNCIESIITVTEILKPDNPSNQFLINFIQI